MSEFSSQPYARLPQLESYSPLDVESYVGRLKGRDREVALNKPTLNSGQIILSTGEFDHVRTVLAGWLPHSLDILSVDNADTFEITDENWQNKSGTYTRHHTYQVWGTSPSLEEIRSCGPLLEVGGPSKYGTLVPRDILPDIITNITLPISKDYVGTVDAYMDATNLATGNGSVGTILAHNLPKSTEPSAPQWVNDLRENTVEEASRAIRMGGRLIWSGGYVVDFTKIVSSGFMPEYIRVDIAFAEDNKSGYFALGGIIFAGSFIKT